ncbi:substrate-binding domain-containing protein [Natronomonas salsuginis]|uniref:TAXI family TRAP transporter solute-binding subunit n=1 Tax=Natronomonas salsuginis TaxID=2217661 RepID=A0A4U5J8L5_9EURY|nr:substrate-binding domain-containing protein [Natronomonas salsuginis]TKR24426.1 TAXI family TRAP transporter solute-binding subunit [Natronomonas salsuginis]
MSNHTTSRRKVLAGAAAATGMLGLAGCAGGNGGDGNGGDGNGESGGNGNGNGSSDDGSGNGGGATQEFTFATSVEGSTAFRIGSTFGEYLRQENLTDLFEINAVVSPGATGGYRMMDQGEAAFSTPSTYGLEVSPDQGPFADNPLNDFNAVRQIRGNFSVQPFLIVQADSGIESWDDLEGQTVSFGSAGAGTRVPSETILDLEIGLENITPEYVGYSDQPAALRGGRVDAIFGYVNNSAIAPGWMQELDATVDWRHIPYSDEVRSEFEQQLPYTSTLEVDGSNFFESFTDTITPYNLTYVVSSTTGLDDEVAYEFAKLSYEHGEALLESDNSMGFYPDPDLFLETIHPDVPVHKGAYDYYVESELWGDYDLTAPPEA